MRKSTILLIAFFVVIIAFSAIKGVVVHPSEKDKNKYVKTISQEYLDLFSPEMQKKFITSGVLSTTTTPSGISASSIIYIYDENGNGRAYDIELFKVGLKQNKPLDEVIDVKEAVRVESTDSSFTELSEGDLNLKFKPGKSDPISTLVWNFNGEIHKPILKQNNLLYYDVRFNYFTLKFDNGTEFWAKRTRGFFLSLQSSGKFIFIKRNNTLYVLFFDDIDAFFLKPNDVLKTINDTLVKPNGNNN